MGDEHLSNNDRASFFNELTRWHSNHGTTIPTSHGGIEVEHLIFDRVTLRSVNSLLEMRVKPNTFGKTQPFRTDLLLLRAVLTLTAFDSPMLDDVGKSPAAITLNRNLSHDKFYQYFSLPEINLRLSLGRSNAHFTIGIGGVTEEKIPSYLDYYEEEISYGINNLPKKDYHFKALMHDYQAYIWASTSPQKHLSHYPLFDTEVENIFSSSDRYHSKYWSFWRDWYQGFLDGKPLDWNLQREVALIPDADWEKGAEHIAALIEPLRAKYELKAKTKDVKSTLVKYQSTLPAGLGHNNPPPELIDTGLTRDDFKQIITRLSAIEEQLEKPAPDKAKLSGILSWLEQRFTKLVDILIKAGAVGATAQITGLIDAFKAYLG